MHHLFFILLFISIFPVIAHASPLSFLEKYRGEKAYENHQYDKAQEHFSKSLVENPKDLQAAYNLGDAYYRAGAYSKAAESFLKSSVSPDPQLREKSFYNLGNSLYRAGEWEKSIAAYEKALEISAQDEDARLNRDFVKKKLEEQKKQDSNQKQPESQPSSESQPESQAQQGSQEEKPNKDNSDPQKQNQNQNQNNQKPEDSKNQPPQNQQPQDSKASPPEQKAPPQNLSPQGQDENKMSPQEAEQWLGSLDEKAGDILKDQIAKKLGRVRKAEKDW